MSLVGAPQNKKSTTYQILFFLLCSSCLRGILSHRGIVAKCTVFFSSPWCMSKRHFKFPIVLCLDLISTIFRGGIRTGRKENSSTSIFLPFLDVLAKKNGRRGERPTKISKWVCGCPQNVGREWVPLPHNTPGILCVKGRRAFVSVCV